MKKLFIGNLSPSTTDNTLRTLFSGYEPLLSVKVITDRDTGHSRGFGFIEIEDDTHAQTAIEVLHGAMLDGSNIAVNLAKPKVDRPRDSFGYSGSRSQYGSSAGNSRY